MNTFKQLSSFSLVLSCLLVAPACSDSESDDGDTSMDDGSTMDDSTTSTDTDSGDGDGDGDSSSGDGDGDSTSGDGDGDGDGFVFDDSPAEDYSQVDRMGMPAINTAVITSKDSYNQSNPAADAAGDFVAEIVANVEGLHAALDDDLTGIGLTPCAASDCVDQAAPLVVPDTIKLDLEMDAGFPNGRRLTDPVMDVTLAVVLLDLSVDGQDALTLVGVNPTENDVVFSDEFPYLVAPN